MRLVQKFMISAIIRQFFNRFLSLASALVWVSIFIMSFRVSLPVIAATFVDNSILTFNGTFSNTQWNIISNGVVLTTAGKTAKTGTYTSTIKSPGSNSTWQTISWVPAAPYGKELPDNAISETMYSAGNANMSNVKTLLHLNDTGSTFADSSGQNVTFSCSTACPSSVTGKFNTAKSFASSSSQFINSTTDLSTLVGGNATVAYWIKTTQTGSDTFYQAPGILGIEQDGAGNDIFYGIISGTGKIQFQVGDSGLISSTNPINDGNWHNIAMSRDATSGTSKIYVDGVLNQTATLGAGVTITQAFSSIGRIENTNTGLLPLYYNGALDEVSMYSRVMTDAEITNLYNRGVQRILFQVRSCPSNTCSGVSYKGPTSTTDYYTDLGGSTNVLPTKVFSNVANNPYLQYQMTMQVDDSNLTPILNSVTITYINAQPSLAFTIRKNDDTADTNVCDLGSASIASVVTCSYRLKVSTNATNGYTIYVATNGGLKNGTKTMTDSAQGSGGSGGTDISTSTAGTENYGALISPGSVTGTGNITLTSRFNAGSTKAVNYNVTPSAALAVSTSSNLPVSPDTFDTVLVTHKLNISNTTAGGYYSQTITYTASPSF